MAFELIDKPKLDVVVFVTVNGLEIPTEIPAESPPQTYEANTILKVKSYVTKGPLAIVLSNVVLIDRSTEELYLSNLAEAKERRTGSPLARVGVMPRIPSGRNH